jgi:hypothetical protein
VHAPISSPGLPIFTAGQLTGPLKGCSDLLELLLFSLSCLCFLDSTSNPSSRSPPDSLSSPRRVLLLSAVAAAVAAVPVPVLAVCPPASPAPVPVGEDEPAAGPEAASDAAGAMVLGEASGLTGCWW